MKKFFKQNFLIYFGVTNFCLSLVTLSLFLYLSDKIFPNIYIASQNVSFLTSLQAKNAIEESVKNRIKTITFVYTPNDTPQEEQTFEIRLHPSDIDIDIQTSLNKAFQYNLKNLPFKKTDIPLSVRFKPGIEYQISQIAQKINVPPIDSQIKIEENQIIATQSQEGIEVDESDLKNKISQYINYGQADLSLKVQPKLPDLPYNTALKIKKSLDSIKTEPLALTFKDQLFTLNITQAIDLIDLNNSETSLIASPDFSTSLESVQFGGKKITDTKLTLNDTKATEFLNTISSQINQEVQEPLFQIEQTTDPQKPKIKEFKPPVQGQTLNIKKSKELLAQAFLNPEIKTISLPVEITPAQNKLTNEYGITELIGRGVSNYAGSIPNRIYNVGLAASRVNGILIPPGEEFSFVNTVGDISSATGYKQAYVIKSGRTVLDDGGGVCQVSTTLFRAALHSGMPVTARTAHAYRVAYYEQGFSPGLDATIFSPSVDFKFKNDTLHYILIQSYIEGTTHYVDFYGTSDGRVSEVSKPIITSQTPPLPELRQDDPTLPKGTVKQVDWAAAGANVVFNRKVTRNGQEIIKESFKSNYRPWQAVYLVGTKEN